jgi:hypothetical protein
MAKALRNSKSIAGTALAVLGMFILYENLAGAFTCLNYVLGANSSEALGVLPAVILAVSRGFEAQASHHGCFLHSFVQHTLQSFWSLLLIMIGTVLSQDNLVGSIHATRKKNRRVVDPATCRSTLSRGTF